MQPVHDSRLSGHQTLVPSPRCILNCQALSIHLPPLSETRDSSSRGKYLSPPMSASPKHSKFVNSPSHHLSYHRQYSISPEPSRPTSIKTTAAQTRKASNSKPRPQHLQHELSTPTSSTDIDTLRCSLQPGSDAHLLREESNDELSSTTQDSPENHHLAAGTSGVARRAKAHVPSACVNCKRKHLACETRRPCNRCVQTGKEVTCIDVQHKKRGRPRLREEENSREVDFGGEYPLREVYPTRNSVLPVPPVDRRTSKSYRELRSQPGTYYSDQRPVTSDPGYAIQPHISGTPHLPISPAASYLAESTPTALLTPDFVVAEHNAAFAEALSLSYQVKGHSFTDLVIPAEREKIQRLQAALRAELIDTSHLPPMHGNFDGSDGMPAIENLDLGHTTMGFHRRSEYWTFRLPKGQSRGFPITISLARTGANFIILTLVQSAMMLPSPRLNPALRSQQLPSPSSTQSPRSPSQSHQPHYGNGHQQANTVYTTQLSPQRSDGPESRKLLMQPSPSVGLLQYQQRSPSSTTVLPYSIARAPSSPKAPRSGPSQHDGAHPSHLHLPPIRTSGTGITESSTSHESRRENHHNKQSPAKGSPQSGRKKKRQRVDIEEMLR